jgi:septal ring factor EnvC (AmiA/AmiB activator)
MPRRSLRPQLNQIRTWVRQGRTDAWIAHQLEVTTQQIAAFKRENKLAADEVEAEAGDFDDEIDLRAEDDALIAAELEEAAKAKAKAEAEAEAAKEKERAARAKARKTTKDTEDADEDDEDGEKPARRRSRRGGRRRKVAAGPLEGTFDHGDEGYGLWLDPAVQDDPVYAEHWAGHRPVEITIEEDQIVIRRAGSDDD